MRAMIDRQSLIQRSHNQAVHVAHDLLSLKYGEENNGVAGGGGGQPPGRYQIPTPDIKHEIGGAGAGVPVGGTSIRFDHGQIPQWHIKVERPDLAQVSQMMGLQRAVNNMAAVNSVRMSAQSPPSTPRDGGGNNGVNHHNMHGVYNPGHGFQHHNL